MKPMKTLSKPVDFILKIKIIIIVIIIMVIVVKLLFFFCFVFVPKATWLSYLSCSTLCLFVCLFTEAFVFYLQVSISLLSVQLPPFWWPCSPSSHQLHGCTPATTPETHVQYVWQGVIWRPRLLQIVESGENNMNTLCLELGIHCRFPGPLLRYTFFSQIAGYLAFDDVETINAY